ncbi:GNAT family N-acetyltransferase [Thermogutta sp.]|uniref:GNAT family N-acetyltransferase n=1 Tax=Thermogutta sp. TaxID=1962930 RepID=UPI003C7A2B76
MAQMQIIQSYQRQTWCEVLARCGWFDVYHLPEYYLAVRTVDEGTPLLLVYEEDPYVAALPILVRSLEGLPELKACHWRDGASAYGYPGLLTNCRPDAPGAEAFRNNWQTALHHVLLSLRIVALFIRQHPLHPSEWMWQGIAAIKRLGPTVVLDLHRSEAEQLQMMRHGHRKEIKEGAKRGITVIEDELLNRMHEFQKLYELTMHAVNADEYYFFPKSYYDALRRHLNGRVKLFFAVHEERLIAGSLFFHCGDVLQYHLSGADPTLGRERAMATKMIIDTVRRWGTANGFRWLHLGGGLGARQDSLFQFKSGFSDLRCDYSVINYIVEPEIYNDLVRRRFGTEAALSKANGWFPAYRCPIVKKAA